MEGLTKEQLRERLKRAEERANEERQRAKRAEERAKQESERAKQESERAKRAEERANKAEALKGGKYYARIGDTIRPAIESTSIFGRGTKTKQM